MSFTLYDAQTTTITATSVSPSGKTGVSTSLTVGPNTAASFTVTNPGSQTAGTAFNLSINALDAYGNTATGFTGSQSHQLQRTIEQPEQQHAAHTRPNVTFSERHSGTASINLFDAQTTSITATQGSITGSFHELHRGPAGAASFVVPNPGTVTAGSAFNETLTAFDAYGNTATGYTGSKTIVFSGPSNSPNSTAPTYPASRHLHRPELGHGLDNTRAMRRRPRSPPPRDRVVGNLHELHRLSDDCCISGAYGYDHHSDGRSR